MSKVWPDWHDRYDFDEFAILKFVPEEPGVFLIRRKFYDDYMNYIIMIDAAENLRKRLLEYINDPPEEIRQYLNKGEILEFAFLRTLDPYTIKHGIVEDLRRLRNP
ncbi:MAG: hypothetical protein ABIL23_06120 [candidate division WOR-3 bacterium]